MFAQAKGQPNSALLSILYQYISELEKCLEQEQDLDFLEQFTVVYVDYANSQKGELINFTPAGQHMWQILTHLFLNEQIKQKHLRDIIQYILEKVSQKPEKERESLVQQNEGIFSNIVHGSIKRQVYEPALFVKFNELREGNEVFDEVYKIRHD